MYVQAAVWQAILRLAESWREDSWSAFLRRVRLFFMLRNPLCDVRVQSSVEFNFASNSATKQRLMQTILS